MLLSHQAGPSPCSLFYSTDSPDYIITTVAAKSTWFCNPPLARSPQFTNRNRTIVNKKCSSLFLYFQPETHPTQLVSSDSWVYWYPFHQCGTALQKPVTVSQAFKLQIFYLACLSQGLICGSCNPPCSPSPEPVVHHGPPLIRMQDAAHPILQPPLPWPTTSKIPRGQGEPPQLRCPEGWRDMPPL